MLKDETLLADACQLIQEQHLNAEWAVHKVMGRLRSFLDVSGRRIHERAPQRYRLRRRKNRQKSCR